MIVVADASPLNYLIQLGYETLLRDLFGRVLVPPAVIEELRHPAAPSSVASWLLGMPSWIEVRSVRGKPDAALGTLDPGEREAIELAIEERADLLLIDERQGRIVATKKGIATTGTLGVLLAGGSRRLIDAEKAFERLSEETTFRATPEVGEIFLKKCREFHGKTD